MAGRTAGWSVILAAVVGCYTGAPGPAGGGPDADPGAAGSGDAGDASGSDDGGGDDDGGGPATPQTCTAVELGSAPMRRLTDVQYANTLIDLFDGLIVPDESFPRPDLSDAGFSHSPEKNVVSLLAAEQIQSAAEAAAEQVVEAIDAVAPCDAAIDECATAFVDEFGSRAFRRPITEDERGLLRAVYDDAAPEGYAFGIAAVVAAALQMPQFLYLVEEGEPVAGEPLLVRLTDHEVAVRLSYLLWDAPPDEELRSAADAGDLSTKDQIQAQAERLFGDERARPALARFYSEWLGTAQLDADAKNAEVFPDFDDSLATSMQEELARFVGALHRDGGTLDTLLTSAETEVNAELAAFYGLPEAGADWRAVELDPKRRSGILTLPAVLAAVSAERATSATRRGKLVRSRFRCDELPPPPLNAESEIDFPEMADEREKWALLEAEPACVTCHRMLNPVGLGLEHYDAVGAWRDVDEGGAPIDASGEVLGIPDGAFDGAVELAGLLVNDPAVARCYVDHWLRYAAARFPEPEDNCTIDDVSAAFEESGHELQVALLALAASDAFLFRNIGEGE